MKHRLIAASAIAAMAVSTPLWAQPTPVNPSPSGVNMGPPVQSSNRMPAGGPATSERGLPGSVERAHHRRHATGHAARARSTGTADQLNRQELATIQSGNPTTLNRMPAGGRATSGGPTH